MKNLLGAAVGLAVSGIVCGAAFADNPVVQELDLQGNVDAIAVFPTSPVTSDNTNASLSGSVITLSSLADANLNTSEASITITYPLVVFNYAAKIGLYSQNDGLKTNYTGELPDGFTNRVNYTANLEVANTNVPNLELTTQGTAGSSQRVSADAVGPFTKDLVLIITIASETTKRLMEGTYSDKLTLKVGSNL